MSSTTLTKRKIHNDTKPPPLATKRLALDEMRVALLIAKPGRHIRDFRTQTALTLPAQLPPELDEALIPYFQQQLLIRQRQSDAPRAAASSQQQIFINPQSVAATQIINIKNTATSKTPPTFQHQIIKNTMQQQQQRVVQKSPTLLSELPATIKLHQIQPLQPIQTAPQPATISRIATPVSILHGQPAPIPSLQQHQSVKQQDVVLGPTKRREAVFSGGRTTEIRDTIIIQAKPSLEPSQLNAQPIISTLQHPPAMQQPLKMQHPALQPANTSV